MNAEQLSVPLLVPLSWQAGAGLPVAEAGTAAVRALATAVSLAERPPLVNEEASGLELEVTRLHQKTQLLIELLALALSRDSSRPAAIELQLSGTACSWHSDDPPALGSSGALALWLHPAAPEPMRWPAEITEITRHEGGSAYVQARLLPLGEAAQSVLDRHIFQLHRRAVAEARSQRS